MFYRGTLCAHDVRCCVGGEGAGCERLENRIQSWHDNPFDDAICGVENLWTPFIPSSDSWPILQRFRTGFDCWGWTVCDANCLPPLESNFECMKFHAAKFDSERATARHRHQINKTFPALNDSACIWCADEVFGAEFPWINKIVCEWRGATSCHFKLP